MSIKIKIVSDFDSKGLKEAEAGLKKLGEINDKVFKTLAAGAGLAAIGIAKFASDSINQASNLAESTNAVNVAFLDAADAVLKVGENSAESFGLARNEFNAAAVRFSAFAERVVGEGGNVAGFIQDITGRAADFASVFNIEVSEALRVFQSGLAGEAEPLKRFGINLLQSEVQAYALASGIIEVGQQMTETQKVQARFGLLMQQTAKTAGDFANTSEGLANSQRILKAEFTDLQAEIGGALLPAFTELVKAVGDALMPRLEELSQFLNSPQGNKLIEDTAGAVLEFGENFLELLPTLLRVGGSLLVFTGTIKGIKSALEGAKLAQLAFNVAVRTNPYVLAATALLAFVSAMAMFRGESDANKLSAQSQSYQVGILQTELDRLNDTYNAGAIEQQEYDRQLKKLTTQLNSAKISTEATAGELRRFNQLRLDGAIASMNAFKEATSLAERQAKTFSDSYSYLESIGAVTRRVSIETDFNTGGSGLSAAELAAQQFEKVQGIIKQASDEMWSAQRQYQERVGDAQSAFQKRSAAIADQFTQDVVDATKKRNTDLEKAFSEHTQAMVNIEEQANEKLASIISDSKNSLRDAYRAATQLTISQVLSDFNKAEEARRRAFEDSRQEAEKNKEAFNEIFTSADPVAALRESLSAQVTKNKALAEQSAALFSAGFSQTFIEQMLEAGDEGSMLVADALLGAAPETRASIQNLFDQIDTQSRTGLDALADQIYETAGLATQELRDLYTLTQAELILSLEAQRVAYEQQVMEIQSVYTGTLQAVTDARNAAMSEAHSALMEEMRQAEGALRIALDAIEKEFRESIAALDGNLAGLGSTIDKLLAKFGALKTAAGQQTQQVVSTTPKPVPTPTPAPVTGALAGFTQVGTLTGQAINGITGILVDSASDLQKIMVYLAERINAAQRFASLEAKTPEEAANARMMATLFAEQASTVSALAGRPDKGVGTVININVKADTSQSLAMVGRSLGNTVAKYVTGGGQVIVSPV
jgi:hypothetical protein